MDELIKNVDVKEMGRRFKLVRQRLGLTQTEVANELDTTQLMIHRIEKGDNILSPLFLATILFYSRSVSLEGLLGKNFDIEDESLFSKDYAVAFQGANGCCHRSVVILIFNGRKCFFD